MVKVGRLNLTSDQRKRTFHLPVKQIVIVPSTSGIKAQRKISKAQLNIRVNNVRRFLSKRFGGYIDIKATGGYVLRNGRLVKERVMKITSFATKDAFKKHKSEVIRQIGSWGKKWKQESVAYEHEGDLFIIEPPKKGSPKIMRKVIGKRMIRVRVPIKRKPTRRRTTSRRIRR